MLFVVSLMTIVGCGTTTRPPDDPDNRLQDNDGDGASIDSDCDDGDPLVHPGADERCNGVDDDCNGDIDDGISFAIYVDLDGDGFGDPTQSSQDCEVPSGWADNGDDCDDTDAALNPDTEWYDDDDGDGFGGTVLATGCTNPGGAVADGDDCDDSDEAVFPGGTEVCDQLDNDCDGTVDEDAVDGREMYGDDDGDGFGEVDDVVVSCWASSDVAAVAGDCDDGDGAIHPHATEVCGDAIDQDCSGRADNGCTVLEDTDADMVIYGPDDETDSLGWSFELDEMTGDSQVDIVAGAPDADYDTQARGMVRVIPGPLDGGESFVDDVATGRLIGTVQGGQLGVRLTTGDLDGDGNTDVFASSGYRGDKLVGVFGPLQGDVLDSEADLIYEHTEWANEAQLIPSPDLDGDGVVDLVVSLPNEEYTAGSHDGAVYLLSGPVSGTLDLSTATARITHSTVRDEKFGYGTIPLGDMDGDGANELALGAMTTKTALGEVYIFDGPLSGELDETAASVTLRGLVLEDLFGAVVEPAGDNNGDGYADLWVFAPGEELDGKYQGSAYLFQGPLTDMGAGEADVAIQGDIAYRFLRNADAKDVDGDGFTDVLVGASGLWGAPPANAGAAGFFYGPISGQRSFDTADVLVEGTTNHALLGVQAELGDLDADGVQEMWLSAPEDGAGVLRGFAL